MIAVSAIFTSRDDAQRAVRQLLSLGIADDRIALLSPGMSDEAVEETIAETVTGESGAGEKFAAGMSAARLIIKAW